MNAEQNAVVARFIQAHLETCHYSVGEIALLLGFRSADMVEGFVRGERKVPLDKVLPLAQALGCDRRQLFVLVQVFIGNSASANEQDWISFLREFFGENVPALTPTLRRRLRLLASIPT